MTNSLLNDRDIRFLLYEVFGTARLLERDRYRDHSIETFGEILDTAKSLAEKYFANHNAKGDREQPAFDGECIAMIPETKAAWDVFADAGFLSAQYDFEEGGIQLPEIVLRAAIAYFCAANIATTGYMLLSVAAANLLREFGSDKLKSRFLPALMEGRFAGAMAMTEPNQGSALADLTSMAVPTEDGSYRLFGQKIFISGGEQNITDNIVYLALARIKGAPPGIKGISLFLCSKYQLNDDGSLGERNDIKLTGLIHKMGYRNTTSTALSFGEDGGAIGYLIGEPNQGLRYMFHMMNEVRIAVGSGAAALAYQGFNYSLDYARERPQGRLPSNKDPLSKQVKIIEHADVRRMLLAQKAFAEGGLGLCLMASSLFEDAATAPDPRQREEAHLLLDLLTPIVKSWPSRYGVQANDLAIQVLGGAGYTSEYPVEQYYRDQRLNPIHEGVEAIHALDLLGRKVQIDNRRCFHIFQQRVTQTIEAAAALEETAGLAAQLSRYLEQLNGITDAVLARVAEDIDLGLANANLYLDVFGRVTVSWVWLRQAVVAAQGLSNADLHEDGRNFYRGKLQAAHYYLFWELPQANWQAELLIEANAICYEMQDLWF